MDPKPWGHVSCPPWAKQKDAKNNGYPGELSTTRRHFGVGTRGTRSSRDAVCPGTGRILRDGEGPATSTEGCGAKRVLCGDTGMAGGTVFVPIALKKGSTTAIKS